MSTADNLSTAITESAHKASDLLARIEKLSDFFVGGQLRETPDGTAEAALPSGYFPWQTAYSREHVNEILDKASDELRKIEAVAFPEGKTEAPR